MNAQELNGNDGQTTGSATGDILISPDNGLAVGHPGDGIGMEFNGTFAKLTTFDHQIAGHFYGSARGKFGLLMDSESGDILKPVADRRGERELAFYRELWYDDVTGDPCRLALRAFVPRFRGLTSTAANIRYMRLEDVSARFCNPSLMDIKLGLRTYDPEATAEKIYSETSKFSGTGHIGIRILGMRVYDTVRDTFDVKTKDYGKQLVADNLTEAFQLYTRNNDHIIRLLVKQLDSMKDWFLVQNRNRYRFISSSVLFIYSTNSVQSGDRNLSPTLSRLSVDVKMIDFAHVFANIPEVHLSDDKAAFGNLCPETIGDPRFDGNGLDYNYLIGLINLINCLRRAINN